MSLTKLFIATALAAPLLTGCATGPHGQFTQGDTTNLAIGAAIGITTGVILNNGNNHDGGHHYNNGHGGHGGYYNHGHHGYGHGGYHHY